MKGMNMPSAMQISYIVFLIVAALFGIGSLSLGLGSVHDPGPGFVPLIASVMLFLCSGIGLLQHVKVTGPDAASLFRIRNLKKAAIVYFGILCYMLIISHLGYALSTFLFMLFLFKAVEPQSWRNAVLFAALAAGFSYLIFVYFLQVQFI